MSTERRERISINLSLIVSSIIRQFWSLRSCFKIFSVGSSSQSWFTQVKSLEWSSLPINYFVYFEAFLLCILAYALSTMEDFSLFKMGSLMMYFSLCSSELLLFCLNAELLKHHVDEYFPIKLDFIPMRLQSSRGGDALMRSDWETFDIAVRRDMLIILTNAIKPVELTAGKIFKINVEQFRAVMGTAFSYYTLLKNFKEKQWFAFVKELFNFFYFFFLIFNLRTWTF